MPRPPLPLSRQPWAPTVPLLALACLACLALASPGCAADAPLASYDACPCAEGWYCCAGRCVPEEEQCSGTLGDSSDGAGDYDLGDGLPGDPGAGDGSSDSPGGDSAGGDSEGG